MLRKILLLLSIALPLAFFVASCGDDDDDPNTCDTSSVTYTNSVAAILNSNCATASACHASSSYNGSLANYADAVAFANFGRIGGAINHDTGFEPMPNPVGTAKLSDCNIDKIETWIAAGTPE
ncbi:MAG: hypothetical protein ACI94Y_002136 [Maribacter sp.]|jgi:hypothetical protein